jgi:voltage-gated potassium channel Kch
VTNSSKIPLGARLRYGFDNSMAKGTPALVGWLGLVTLVLVGLFATVVLLTGMAPEGENGEKPGVFRQLFNTLMHAMDPGTVAGDTGSGLFLVFMLVLTLAGLFVVSALIGVISAGIDARIEELRRGRSLVIEKDHTIILGWSDSVFTIIRELVIANESRHRPAIVILADEDKVAMEEAVRNKVEDLNGTRVICRSGSPIDLGDLALASPNTARSIIVLGSGGPAADIEVTKILLALRHNKLISAPIVAEIQDPGHLESARLAGGSQAILLNKRETVARLIVQTSRQSGAAAVYSELFDFDGDEIYFHRSADLDDLTYGEGQQFHESATLIGMVGDDGTVVLNPPADTPLRGRELVYVTADDSVLTAGVRSTVTADRSDYTPPALTPAQQSRVLVLGWNQRARAVVRELDNYAEPGSQLLVVSEYGEPTLPAMANLTTEIRMGQTADRAALEVLDLVDFDQIIVLAYSDDLPVQQADARTLVTLLLVRQLTADAPVRESAIVSEILDDRNRPLAQVAEVDDVIVSDEILSLMVTQLSEEPRLEAVFADLLDEEGAEVYLRSVDFYVAPGTEVSWAALTAAATARGETAIGYRVAADAHNAEAGFGVAVNPAKSETFACAAGDRLIVLAVD